MMHEAIIIFLQKVGVRCEVDRFALGLTPDSFLLNKITEL